MALRGGRPCLGHEGLVQLFTAATYTTDSEWYQTLTLADKSQGLILEIFILNVSNQGSFAYYVNV